MNRSKDRKRSLTNAIIVFGPDKLDSAINSLYVKHKNTNSDFADKLYSDKKWVREHFRTKKWGKIKITAALKQQRVSSYNIQKALDEIDQTAYLSCLQRLATVKWNTLKKETTLNKKVKATNYLLQKGYESNLIRTALVKLQAPKET